MPITPSLKATFTSGKTIRFIVGFTAGGGYDAYTRTIARHMGKHIPGHPTMVVDNMSGAGSMISANYTFKVAKADGLTIGHFIGGCSCNRCSANRASNSIRRNSSTWACRRRTILLFGVHKSTGITDVNSWLAVQASGKIRRCRQRLRQ